MPDVITMGETLAVFDASSQGPMRYVSAYERHSGGAETNVAVGITRLGFTTGWISRLGDDEFGRFILYLMRGEGVDVTRVKLDSDNPTGVFFRQRNEIGESINYYYRKYSAASFLSEEDVDEDYIKQAKIFHATGITAALSESCRAALEKAMIIAKKNGLTVSFDPNLRLKLWSIKEARHTLTRLMHFADIVMPGLEECKHLFGTEDVEKVHEILTSYGVRTSIIKLGAEGAVGFDGCQCVASPGFPVKKVVDPFGAGDGFAAGFLAGRLSNKPFDDCLRIANAVGAIAVTVKGNIEAYPTMRELNNFLSKHVEINR